MTSRMPKARIPKAGKKEFVLGEEDWKRIEVAYGQGLSAEVREHILFVTSALLTVGPTELHAPALKSMIKQTTTLEKVAEKLLEMGGWPVKKIPTFSTLQTISERITALVNETPLRKCNSWRWSIHYGPDRG